MKKIHLNICQYYLIQLLMIIQLTRRILVKYNTKAFHKHKNYTIIVLLSSKLKININSGTRKNFKKQGKKLNNNNHRSNILYIKDNKWIINSDKDMQKACKDKDRNNIDIIGYIKTENISIEECKITFEIEKSYLDKRLLVYTRKYIK